MTAVAKPAVCLVDDDPELRDYFKTLTKSSGLPAFTFASAEEFLENFAQKPIGCIVLDVRMPGMGGLELLEALRQRHVLIPVILLTAHADVRLAVKAMRLGAMDVLEKPYREEDLLAAVRQAFARFEKLKLVQSELQSIAPRISSLTPRELEVLDQMVAGKKNRTIAEELGISTKTLDIHRANIMRKMKTKTVADLVRWRLLERGEAFALQTHG
ncbi:MAG: response regulator [Gemmataceae bacterium]|nr:response regulator [Gemmataceae bacterium]